MAKDIDRQMAAGEYARKLGLRIAAVRKAKGWSREELGVKCNPTKSKQNIERIEKGQVNVTVFTLQEIAKALKVHISEFFR